MVTRYPKEHDAEVVYDSTGHLEHGEWIPGVHKTVHLHGRFDHSNSSRHVLKRDSNGDQLEDTVSITLVCVDRMRPSAALRYASQASV